MSHVVNTNETHPSPGLLAAEDENSRIVRRLVAVISGDLEFSEADSLMDPDVKIFMGETLYIGIKTWFLWVHFIRTHGRLENLRCEIERISCSGDRVEAVWRWRGRDKKSYRARTVLSDSHAFSYRVHLGRITHIWTQRENYVFVLGPWFKMDMVHHFYLLRAMLYWL